ncbi:MAG TPA: phosphatase PAP2 family protein [Actinocatenispora sp.]
MRRDDALFWLVTYTERHGMGADRSLFTDINHLSAATGWAHGFMAAYALWGGLVALTVVWAACWLVARRADDVRSLAGVILTGVAAVLALGINQIIGPLVDRPRPFVAMPHVLLLLPHSADPSFPSDHAIIAGAFVGGLVVVSRRWGTLAAVLALFLAFARVYVGVHYPTDVAGGLLIGALVGLLLVSSNARTLLARPLAGLAGTPLRPVLTAAPPRPVPAKPEPTMPADPARWSDTPTGGRHR